MYRLGNFTLNQSLLSPNSLSFSMHKVPEEDIREAQFQVCGEIIGKEITVEVDTENVEQVSLQAERDSTAEISSRPMDPVTVQSTLSVYRPWDGIAF